MLKILVFGSGSIGTFLGTKLYAAGHNVLLYGRRKLESLKEQILINGDVYQLPPKCYQLQSDDYNAILVTTKLYNVQSALEQIKKYQFNPQIIAFIQNGIVDKDFYGEFKNHPGFITVSVFNGYNLTGNKIIVTESNLGLQVEDNLAGEKICELLISAGIRCYTTANISQMRAQKLIFNAAVNALSAIEKKTYGELIIDKKIKEVVDGITQESWTVLKDDYHLPSLAFLQEEIYQLITKVKNHYSSMYQDFISGRNTEIEFLNGFIINLGREKGIKTPYNQQVYLKIVEQQGKAK
ncbi:MAG: 2-dehydropantoate 2-reductase [Nostocaceae cyanobacterium]|nr:2-dehydropantoate 2-reductase [Nostocaceae cyanobacterium]